MKSTPTQDQLKCGDANPKGNVKLVYKGGCDSELDIHSAYRCVGCGGWFHKDCILEHFKLEKQHDWGRVDERKKLGKIIMETPMLDRNDDEEGDHVLGDPHTVTMTRKSYDLFISQLFTSGSDHDHPHPRPANARI